MHHVIHVPALGIAIEWCVGDTAGPEARLHMNQNTHFIRVAGSGCWFGVLDYKPPGRQRRCFTVFDEIPDCESWDEMAIVLGSYTWYDAQTRETGIDGDRLVALLREESNTA